MTIRIMLDDNGNEMDTSTSNIADPATTPAMTYRDTSNSRVSLDENSDPERMLQQAQIDDLAHRTRRAEDLALELLDKTTGQPRAGQADLFARRMAIAAQLRERLTTPSMRATA